jgi:hypothetical protein
MPHGRWRIGLPIRSTQVSGNDKRLSETVKTHVGMFGHPLYTKLFQNPVNTAGNVAPSAPTGHTHTGGDPL